MDDFSKTETVLSQLPRIAAAAAEWITNGYPGRLLERAVDGTESPIEAVFALWWAVMYPLVEPTLSLALHRQFGFAPINGRNYRADFVIWPADLDAMSRANALGVTFNPVIVELDGHDFHERTKEQVIERNQRDRAFQEQGYLVLHFSGSEIHRDPYECFSAAYLLASKEWARYWDAFTTARYANSVAQSQSPTKPE